jgi:predicted DCC family thiol-disulfide oxidoreductase YuxK
MSAVAYPLVLYVDDACPLCHAEMAGLLARDARGCLRMMDASAAGFSDPDARVAGLDRATLLHRLHARDAQGRWLVGVPVFAAAYEVAGIAWMARLLRVRWLRPLWDAGYALVADHRWLLVKLGAPRLVAALLEKKIGPEPLSRFTGGSNLNKGSDPIFPPK